MEGLGIQEMNKKSNKDILNFIKDCIIKRRILWTYHINMRLKERFINREEILNSIDSYEIIEEYPDDKFLPSYLVYAKIKPTVVHILFGVDSENDFITIITAYKPTKEKWNNELKKRLK